MDPRRRARARRNLLFFWLVVVGIPILIVASCVAFHLTPCCTDYLVPPSASG